MTRQTFAALIAAVIFFQGCYSYPESRWGRLPEQEGEDCPAISGRYYNKGVSASGYTSHLLNMFTNQYYLSLSSDQVEIEMPSPGVLKVKAFDKDKVVHEEVYYGHKDGLSCEDGAVVIASSGFHCTEIAAFMAEKKRLLKNDAGDLVFNYRGWGVGCIYILPAWGGSDWYRFEAVRDKAGEPEK